VAAFAGALILISALLPAVQNWSVVFVLAATFTPHALLLWLYALVVIAVTARRKAKWLAVLTAFGLVCNALAVLPYADALLKPTSLRTGTALRVMTLNLRFGYADTDGVGVLVDEQAAQVLVLTEISQSSAAQLTEKLKKSLPYQAGTPDLDGGAAGTMIFSRYPLTVVDTAQTGYHSVAVEVADPAGRYVIAGIHAVNPIRCFESWLTDGSAIAALTTRQMSSPLIVAGDFNATAEHLLLRRILATGLTDAVRQAGPVWSPTYPTDIPLLPPLIGIDHILLNSRFHANKTHTVPIKGSDHLGLVAELVRR
jgi:endonuclease/exonuclease/phosphatase (EEP) superfamily protein YafD